MKVEDIIDSLQDYCFINDDILLNEKKNLIDNYQIEFLDGYISILMNKIMTKPLFEVYLCIKSKNKIACPLLYKVQKNILDAKEYYNELKNLINNSDEKIIINRCKIRE